MKRIDVYPVETETRLSIATTSAAKSISSHIKACVARATDDRASAPNWETCLLHLLQPGQDVLFDLVPDCPKSDQPFPLRTGRPSRVVNWPMQANRNGRKNRATLLGVAG